MLWIASSWFPPSSAARARSSRSRCARRNGTPAPGSGVTGTSAAITAASRRSRPSPRSAETARIDAAAAASQSSQAGGRSALPATRRAGPGPLISVRSSSCRGSDRSSTLRTRSAVSVCRRVRSIPKRSIASSVSLTPAVSTSSTGHPSKAVRAVTRSRVVPGVGSTIARWYPARALSSRLFPTFGRPAITTRQPVVSRTPTCPRAMSRSRCSSAP